MTRQNPNRSLLRDGHALSIYALKLADMVVIGLAGTLAHGLRFGWTELLEPERYLYALFAGIFLALIVFSELGVYRTWRAGSRGATLGRLLLGWPLVLAVLAAISFLSKTGSDFSRLWFGYWAILGFAGLVGVRLVFRIAMRILATHGYGIRRVLLVGPAERCAAVLERCIAQPSSGVRVVGFWTPPGMPATAKDGSTNLQLVGLSVDGVNSFAELAQFADRGNVDDVWLTWSMKDEVCIHDAVSQLGDIAANIRWLPDFHTFRLINHGVTVISGQPMYDLSVTPLSGINLIVKEVEDKVLSGLILLLISPLLLLIAAGVKLSSPGPVFYRQERVGWNNRPFMMLKFRSMPVDTEVGGVRWGSAKDKAITPFGRFIRKTSLDELPQFINVLKGDMSIVGPRPERTVFVHQFKDSIPGYMKKHMMKAGITGWAQINGLRGDTDLAKRIEYDLFYIEHWSVWLDLRIIAQTALKMFFDRSAY